MTSRLFFYAHFFRTDKDIGIESVLAYKFLFETNFT